MKLSHGTVLTTVLWSLTILCSSVKANVVQASQDCVCNVNDESSGTFKCGDHIYVCPGVNRICSEQESENSDYYLITQDQCNAMQKKTIEAKCVPLPEYGICEPFWLSNRVCYDDNPESIGFHGMKKKLIVKLAKIVPSRCNIPCPRQLIVMAHMMYDIMTKTKPQHVVQAIQTHRVAQVKSHRKRENRHRIMNLCKCLLLLKYHLFYHLNYLAMCPLK